jgi:hypothetical protein
MPKWLVVCVCLLVPAAVIAQPRPVAPGEIRCPQCSLTGQKPEPPGFEASQVAFVPDPIPAFHENQTFRINMIARVVHAAPLVLETLDSTVQMVDRSMKVVEEDRGSGRDPATCGGPTRYDEVDLASRPVVSALKLNDIVTGAVIVKRDGKKPESILTGSMVLTNVRKVSGPIRFFHAVPVPDHCRNRSGRLVIYAGPDDSGLTEVYNDGGLYHRDAADMQFTRERLSSAELAGLLAAFRAVDFDALPSTFPSYPQSKGPMIALIGARYQSVTVSGREARLAPLLARLDGLAAKATSHAQYILRREGPIPLAVFPWPHPAIALDQLLDSRLRWESTPFAWTERVPDDLLAKLPLASPTGAEEAERDPNRVVHFSQDGKLYRVGRPADCHPAGTCAFRNLEVAEVAEPASGDCVAGRPNCQEIRYADGRRVRQAQDPRMTTMSGRLWPRDMTVRLRDVTPAGAVISHQEYERHKAALLPLLRSRLASDFIEGGFLYPRVRLEMR